MTTPVRYAPPSGRTLLARVLDQPHLVEAIRGLAPRALARLVDQVGLEDAGELVALATTDQLAAVLDEDLWRADRAGVDEQLDAARFVRWLEVLVEAGPALAARRVAELAEDLVVEALRHRVLVLDLDQLAVELAEAGEDADGLEKQLDSGLYLELDAYRVIARAHDGWDAIALVLAELDSHHHDVLTRLLERLAALTGRDADDDGGLSAVLSAAESLADDVAGAREERRGREGYVAPSAAAAFLTLAATTELSAAGAADRDPLTRAYFRELAPGPLTSTATAPAAPRAEAARPHALARADLPSPAERLTALLAAEGVLDDGPPTRALAAGDDAGPEHALRAALTALAGREPAVHTARVAELAYLANVLVAGAAAGERRFRPAEAAAAVVTVCARGLAHLRARAGATDLALVTRTPADLLFRLGWRLLHEETGDPARALLVPRPAGTRPRPPRGRARR